MSQGKNLHSVKDDTSGDSFDVFSGCDDDISYETVSMIPGNKMMRELLTNDIEEHLKELIRTQTGMVHLSTHRLRRMQNHATERQRS